VIKHTVLTSKQHLWIYDKDISRRKSLPDHDLLRNINASVPFALHQWHHKLSRGYKSTFTFYITKLPSAFDSWFDYERQCLMLIKA
jgi:hypothetical protein